MTLSAKGIRAEIVTLLKTKVAGAYPTIAEDRVEEHREDNYEPEHLPAISVISLGGSDTDFSLAGHLSARHTERVAIVGDVVSDSGMKAGDLVDTLEDQIGDCLLGDPSFTAALTITKVDTARKIDDSTGLVFGHVVIVLECAYAKGFSGPRVSETRLSSVWVKTEPADPAGADVSERQMLEVQE